MQRAALVCLGLSTLALSCRLPNTLGLPCESDSHCDGDQVCSSEGVCAEAGGSSESTDTNGDGDGDGDGDGTSTSDESGSTDDTTSEEETGPSCGQEAGGCDKIDVLFVIDNSASIETDLDKLIPLLDQDVFAEILDLSCDYHIGVTTTEAAPDFQPPECQELGALSQAGALNPELSCFGDFDHVPYVTTDDDLNALGCLLVVGKKYDTNEQQAQTTLNALGEAINGPGGCNEGFLRDDAGLMIILVTDEDDDDDSADPNESPERTGSPGSPGDWYNALTDIKDPKDIGMLALMSDQPAGCDWMPLPGNSDGTGAEYGERILTWMNTFAGAGYGDHTNSANICLDNEDLILEIDKIGDVVTSMCRDSGL